MVNFDFNQISTAIIAFVANIEGKLKELIQDLPVFVLQSGDGNYMLDAKFNSASKEIYEQVPRFVMKFDSFDHESDMDTYIYNKFEYTYNNKIYSATARRLQLNITCNGTLLSANFIQALEHMEILLDVIRRENVFTYEFCGNTYQGAFACDRMQDVEFPEMDTNDLKFKQSLDITLQLHLFLPRVETIEEYDNNITPTKISIDVIDLETKNLDKDPKTITTEETTKTVEVSTINDDRKDIVYPYYKSEDYYKSE